MTASTSACAASTKIVVSLHDVSHFYGHVRALDHLSLEVPAGCMVGLLGPDGVGKSTTFDLISGARKIQTGTVDVLGGDMRDARHRLATCPRIAYMPQGLGKNLDPTLSVFENVDFFGRLFGLGRQNATPHRELVARHRARTFLGPAGGQAVRRHEAEAGPVLLADP